MGKNCLPIILLFCVCCTTTPEKSDEHIDMSCMGLLSDVIVIKDSFHMSSDFSSTEKDYLVSSQYIGTRYISDQDTVIKEPIPCFPPNVMKAIHSFGKEIIPYLISHIDVEKIGVAEFINPYESNLQNMVILSPWGINYAYMIELILAKDSINDNIFFADGYDIWYEKMKTYKVYSQCVIIRKKDLNNLKKAKISFADIKSIKAIYNDWWESNKKENLDTLRKKWRENGSPLQKSSFMWI